MVGHVHGMYVIITNQIVSIEWMLFGGTLLHLSHMSASMITTPNNNTHGNHENGYIAMATIYYDTT